MKRTRLTPIALISTLMMSGAFAQSNVNLDPVTILGQQEATTAGAQIIKGLELNSLKARTSDTASLIMDTPGATVNVGGGVSGLPSIHGMADDRLNTSINGMDLISSCPNHMNSPLSYVDPSAVESITVYTGIKPVSIGGDSIGGAIIVETVPPPICKQR